SLFGSYALAKSGMMQQQQQQQLYENDLNNPHQTRLHLRGWMQSVIDIRIQLAKLARHMEKIEKLPQTQREYKHQIQNYQNYTIDVSPLVQIVTAAIETVGVRGVLFDVLNDDFDYFLYLPEKPSYKCLKEHGVGKYCTATESWWLYHFVGAIIADHFVKNTNSRNNSNGILWDGITQHRIASMEELLHSIQRFQQMPYVNPASFHSEHAIIWQYLAYAEPKLAKYPQDMVLQFCRYEFAGRSSAGFARTVGKGIDHECYHGFGHAMYYVVAKRQMKRDMGNSLGSTSQKRMPTTTPQMPARIQIRPNSGFELDEQGMCQVYQLCKNAQRPEDDKEEEFPYSKGSRICLEGVVHSVRLFSDTRHDKAEAITYVYEEMQRCEKLQKKKLMGKVEVLDTTRTKMQRMYDDNDDHYDYGLDAAKETPPLEAGHAKDDSDEPQEEGFEDEDVDFSWVQRHS
ncbi:MAG: hypothetical protein SGARI_002995, partial [Bacillariaceae sp.]